MEKAESLEPVMKKGFKVYIPLIVVICVVLAGCWYWYREYSKYISSDDAFIDSDRVMVGSKIAGRIAKLYVVEGDSVTAGLLVAELDSSELVAQKNLLLSNKKLMAANTGQAEAKYLSDVEGLKVIQINVQKAKDDYARAKTQFSGGVITQEQNEHLKKGYESAEAQLNAAKSQLLVSKALINSARASVDNASSQIGVIESQLKNTKLYAPFNGVIAKRWLLAGDVVQPGQSIYTISNNKNFWVSVYLEETNLNQIYIGQKAIIKIDAFPDTSIDGSIYFIGSNTASQFSLIPPNNASGNFTKITQRVPLKISLNLANSKIKLLSGMSVVVKIIK